MYCNIFIDLVRDWSYIPISKVAGTKPFLSLINNTRYKEPPFNKNYLVGCRRLKNKFSFLPRYYRDGNLWIKPEKMLHGGRSTYGEMVENSFLSKELKVAYGLFDFVKLP